MTPRSTKVSLLVCAACFTFGVSNSWAEGNCAPVVVLPATIQTRAYDPFSINPLIDDVAIGYRDADCDSEVSVDATIGLGNEQPLLRSDGHDLNFKLSFAGLEIAAQPASLVGFDALLNKASFILPPGSVGNLSQQVRIIIPEGQIVPPGRYNFLLPASVQNASGILSQKRDTSLVRAEPISISTQVLAVMKLGVLGCDLSSDSARLAERATFGDEFASACKLNIGDPSVGMLDGDARRARLVAQANVNFKIAMVSRNGGVLKLAGSSQDERETERVHYTASLQGLGQNFEFVCNGAMCGSSDLIEPSASPLGNDLYFNVTVSDPDLRQKRAGRYVDVITLIIQPAS